jgi:hypothetical protein
MEWLMEGKPGSAPINELGEAYSLPYFESVQAMSRKGKRPEISFVQDAGESLLMLHRVLAKADKSESEKVILYRLEKFTREMANEFGMVAVDDARLNRTAAKLRQITEEAYHAGLAEPEGLSSPPTPQKKQPSRKSASKG